MHPIHKYTFVYVSLALATLARPANAAETINTDTTTLPEITVHGQQPAARQTINSNVLLPIKPYTTDSATLLEQATGISLHSAGGFSSLPVYHGLADDRLLVNNDGVTTPASCPNHMNSPLSYIVPSKVDSVEIFNGAAPVSAGGDNIGGVIKVKTAAPIFSDNSEWVQKGEIGSYYRSNGHAWGANASATVANDKVSLSYSGSTAQSDDYTAARSFKTGQTVTGRGWINGDTIGSSAYKTENHELTAAYRGDNELIELKFNAQHTPYEGFPNQRMDMTGNNEYQISLHLNKRYDWGNLDARLYDQYVNHSMQFGDDKQYTYGSYAGMPMNTASHTQGGTVVGELPIGQKDNVKIGAEFQRYRLDDWWPAAGTTSGMMGPNTFWNINNGQRDRFDLFSEINHNWSDKWVGIFGARVSSVHTSADTVQGYSSMMYGTDANNFNNGNRKATDTNIDLSALARYTPSATEQYELAYGRKTRSPNLYERYTWSTLSMAAIMNNFAGDGNGYVGNPNLKPEVANTFSFTAGWHDADNSRWSVRLSPYYSYVQDYIDAKRLSTYQNSTNQFVVLQYVNQDAELYGIDLDGKLMLLNNSAWGRFDLTGKIAYTRGKNLTTGDNLYNIMPLNAKVAVQQSLGKWSSAVEIQAVQAKRDVSEVRNEWTTPGYGLLNLRGRYEWKSVSVSFGVENALNHFYYQPLGGAYTGQGTTMGTNSINWGVGIPGPARTLYVAFNYKL